MLTVALSSPLCSLVVVNHHPLFANVRVEFVKIEEPPLARALTYRMGRKLAGTRFLLDCFVMPAQVVRRGFSGDRSLREVSGV